MKEKNLETGHLGEDIAKMYLEGKGYRIIEQNYKNKYAEIDLVARGKDVLVFVEVRTKIGGELGSPEESLTADKIKRLIRNALAYVTKKRYERSYRIDAVCIVLSEDRQAMRVTHYENITG